MALSALPSSPKVLIVDDDRDRSAHLANQFRHLGFTTIRVQTEAVAHSILRFNTDVGLIVTADLHVDRVGADFVRRLRRDAELAGFPVMVVSTFLPRKDISRLIKLDRCSFVPLPASAERLREEAGKLGVYVTGSGLRPAVSGVA